MPLLLGIPTRSSLDSVSRPTRTNASRKMTTTRRISTRRSTRTPSILASSTAASTQIPRPMTTTSPTSMPAPKRSHQLLLTGWSGRASPHDRTPRLHSHQSLIRRHGRRNCSHHNANRAARRIWVTMSRSQGRSVSPQKTTGHHFFLMRMATRHQRR